MEADDVSPIAALPPEVLQQVFSFVDTRGLCAVGDVCSQWRALSRCPSLWKHHDVDVLHDREHLLQVLGTAPELASLTIRGRADDLLPGYLALEQSGTLCGTVRKLVILHSCARCDLRRAVLRRYAPRAETLETDGLTVEILHALGAARRLRALRLAGHVRLDSAQQLKAAILACPALLEDLDLTELGETHGDPSDRVTPSGLVKEFVEAKGGTLRRLILPTTRFAVIMDDVLDEVARRCPQLESLGADFCDGNRLVKSLPRLRRLRLVSSLRQPSPEDIEKLEKAVHHARTNTVKAQNVHDAVPLARVEHLDVRAGSQAENLDYTIALVRLCPRLRSLDLAVADLDADRGERLREMSEALGAVQTRLRVTTSNSREEAARRVVLSALPFTTELIVNGKLCTAERETT